MDEGAVEEDVAAVRAWWDALAEDVPADVEALWFGLTELETDAGAVRHLYVAGCPGFDAADDAGDWATDYVWWPEGRYVSPPNLAAHPGDYPAVLRHAAAVVTRLAPQHDASVQGVAVGFDEGDFTVTYDGARPS